MTKNEWQRAYRQRMIVEGRCSSCSRRHSETTKQCAGCKQVRRDRGVKTGPLRRAKAKTAAITAYGGECACCGEVDERFLTLDHVNNDGAAHRRSLSPSGRKDIGANFYRQMQIRDWPDDPPLQVLCFNCNNGKRVNKGICPHQEIG